MNRRAFLFLASLLSSDSALAERPPYPLDRVRPPLPVGDPIVAKPVSGIAYDPDHRCDNCGYQSPQSETDRGIGTFIQKDELPDGSHTHQCPKCGAVWKHGGTESSSPVEIKPLAVPGCASGNCPSSATPYRRGLIFRR